MQSRIKRKFKPKSYTKRVAQSKRSRELANCVDPEEDLEQGGHQTTGKKITIIESEPRTSQKQIQLKKSVPENNDDSWQIENNQIQVAVNSQKEIKLFKKTQSFSESQKSLSSNKKQNTDENLSKGQKAAGQNQEKNSEQQAADVWELPESPLNSNKNKIEI